MPRHAGKPASELGKLEQELSMALRDPGVSYERVRMSKEVVLLKRLAEFTMSEERRFRPRQDLLQRISGLHPRLELSLGVRAKEPVLAGEELHATVVELSLLFGRLRDASKMLEERIGPWDARSFSSEYLLFGVREILRAIAERQDAGVLPHTFEAIGKIGDYSLGRTLQRNPLTDVPRLLPSPAEEEALMIHSDRVVAFQLAQVDRQIREELW